MLPGSKDLEVYQGDSYVIPVRVRQRVIDENGDPVSDEGGEPTFEPIDLTGHTPSAQIRPNPNGEIITEFIVSITDPVNGELEMRLPHERSTLLERNCEYDLQTRVGEGEEETVRTWLRGSITVQREITR